MEITTELNGIKYLIVELLITSKTNEDRLMKELSGFGAIYQGVKEVDSGGFRSKPFMVLRVLVPENKVVDFGKAGFNNA